MKLAKSSNGMSRKREHQYVSSLHDILGTLRTDNGDVREDGPEKQTTHPFYHFLDYPKSPELLKRREFRLELKRADGAREQK